MKKLIKRVFEKPVALMKRFPLASFVVVLGVLVGLMVVGNGIRGAAEVAQEKPKVVKKVEVLEVGGNQVQYVSVQGKVEKSGSVKVLAQAAGVVQKIDVKEGEVVKKGGKVVELSSTYGGASVASLQRQLAQVQYDNTLKTYEMQKSLIATQRKLAQVSAENTEELRQVSDKSIDNTTNVIDLNESLRNRLRDSLSVLELDPVGNAVSITQTKASIAQLESGLAQLYAGLRATRYQTDVSKPPTELARLGKEATLKQLELQEQGLESAKQAVSLQLRLAQVQESLMMPTLAQSGVVERVYVTVGQSVAPGMALFSVKLDGGEGQVKVSGVVGKEIASRIIRGESVLINSKSEILNSKQIQNSNDQNSKQGTEIKNYYVATSATDGVGYAVTGYGVLGGVENGEWVEVQVPIAVTGESRLVPVNVVYQTQGGAYVYVVRVDEQGKQIAQTRKVELGQVVGDFVEVNSGLEKEVQVIVNRNVLEGDAIEIAQ